MLNLKLAFPKKSDDELKVIQKKFFHYFTDFFVESLKAITLSEKEIKKRYRFKNLDIINDLHKKDRDIVLMMAHYGNWEWVIGLPLHVKIDTYIVYSRLSNPNIDTLIKKSRSKFGMHLVKASDTIKTVKKNFSEKKRSLFIMISDQSPQLEKTYYWRGFFGNRVPVHVGGDVVANTYNYAVVNANVTRVKRGYYEVDMELITESTKGYPRNKVIDIYTEIIEKHISKQPEFYLWSHRRFKHLGKEPKKIS